MSFRSPPSRMKATSRRTTYPRMSMIQRWKREKSAGDQTALQVHFLLVFQEISDDEFSQTDCVSSNPLVSLQRSVIRTTYPKLSMIQRFIPEIQPPEHYWFFSKICSSLSLSTFLYFFLLFFFNWWPFAVLQALFSIITILSLIHAFMYFILFFM